VARAEAKIHGKSLGEVHFHEVGAVDSIIDIVGAAICIDFLKPDRIIASPVEMGGGFVQCAHGTFPVPAPATLEIMKGKPVKLGAVPFETATPTGVAILAALADEFTETPAFTVTKTGYGIGHRDGDIPNVLRVCMGETGDTAAGQTVEAAVVECNIDDMNPEYYGYVMEQLFAAGADDVFLQPVIMKKSRPSVLLSVLCAPEKTEEMKRILFTETTTLGVRCHSVKKQMLERLTETADTPWGKVGVKVARFNGKEVKSKPEYDDCAAIARKNGIPIEQVYRYIRQKTVPEEQQEN
ncbi:MAG: nickel pincer cofactor biosynthesis protein LarC, partial [Bacteroidales bacterium]|nr:nickel pincer cofactor biosynthesis protein LarC [Bacteroidales bacterium]